ncbi:MAG: EAL domain-containing protein [Motiliproteus sp.]
MSAVSYDGLLLGIPALMVLFAGFVVVLSNLSGHGRYGCSRSSTYVVKRTRIAMSEGQSRRTAPQPDLYQQSLGRSLDRLAELGRVQQHIHIGNWLVDLRDGNRIYWSDEMFRLLGCEPGSFEPSHAALMRFVHPDDRIKMEQGTELAMQTPEQLFRMDVRITRRDGSERVIRETAEIICDDEGVPIRAAGVMQDITEQTQALEALKQMTSFDALTGLPNRQLFQDRLQYELDQAERHQRQLGLLFIDLDHFKRINESLGQDAGDRALAMIADRLRARVKEGHTLGRRSADEFALLIPSFRTIDCLTSYAEQLLEQIRLPFTLDDHCFHLSASIGISIYSEDGHDCDSLVRHADMALFQAKSQGRDRFCFFTERLQTQALKRVRLENQLREGLQCEAFSLHYQPKIELHSGRVCGMEALVRWTDPSGQLISPADFIPVAEETGLILPLGKWILEQACQQTQQWRLQGHPNLRVAVNLSAKQFTQPDLIQQVISTLESSGLPPQNLELEITESMVIDDTEAAIHTMTLLRKIGVSLAIDDFGTGYSSLEYLKRFPITCLKIDQSFIKDLVKDPRDRAIVKAIIYMTRILRLEVVAEGVEDEEISRFLTTQGCLIGQGYFYSRPLDVVNFERYLQQCVASANSSFGVSAVVIPRQLGF